MGDLSTGSIIGLGIAGLGSLCLFFAGLVFRGLRADITRCDGELTAQGKDLARIKEHLGME